MTRTANKSIVLIILSFILIGCSPLVISEQKAHSDFTLLQVGNSIGQTFTANFDGLDGVSVYLKPEIRTDGFIRLDLKPSVDAKTILASSKLNLEQIHQPGFYRFEFSPQQSSNQSDYYIHLEITNPTGLLVGTAPGESYIEGSLYRNQIPVDQQLSFDLEYQTTLALYGLVKEGALWIGIILIATFLFVLPGWIVLSLYWDAWNKLHWGEKLGLAIGLSIVCYPILILWAYLVNLKLGLFFAWLPPLITLGLWIWNKRKNLYPFRISFPKLRKRIQYADIALIVVLILIFFIRFWVVRSLDIPMWGDGYQHTMITQLISDNKGLFEYWVPYTNLQTFTYHYGFHSLASLISWITSLQVNQSVLLTGQLVNAFAAIVLIPFAMKVKRSIWAGVVAVLCAGLLFQMPMFYTNWSRYTQLTGLVILPVLAYFLWVTYEKKNNDLPLIIISCLLMSGLALSHFRVLIFALLFILAFLILYIRQLGWRKLILRTTSIGIGALVIFLPWLINVFRGRVFNILGAQLSTPASQLSAADQQYIAIGQLSFYLPIFVWALLVILVGWSIWRRDRGAILVILWWGLIFLAANPYLLNLPGAGAITTFAVMIAMYIPAAILIGAATGWLTDIKPVKRFGTKTEKTKSPREIKSAIPVILTILTICLAFWGTTYRKEDIDPFQFSLATRPDLRASTWIKENMVGEEIFLVNSLFAYSDTLIVGSDGGWWLPLLADHQTTLPPLTYGVEQGPIPQYVKWVNALTANIEVNGIDHPDVLEMMKERDITHVYIGQRQGSVNTDQPLLNIDELTTSPHYDLEHRQDRTWIFKVNHTP